jgi:hypothetical protein
MKNVTISMDEELAAWVRVEAAKADKSVSAWIAGVLQARRGSGGRRGVDASGKSAIERFLERAPADLGFRGKLPSREEMNERESLRRFESASVRDGPKHAFEAESSDGVAKKPGPPRRRRSKRPGSS